MDTLTLFFERNIVVIYFFYGLAFFSLGLAVWLEAGHTVEFRLGRAMGPLAGFGIIHGLHEWFEMFQRLGEAQATNIPEWLLLDELRLGHLVLSFVLLIIFGVRLICYNQHTNGKANDGYSRRFVVLITGLLLLFWLGSGLLVKWLAQPPPTAFLTVIDVLGRYFLGIPGALLASWAIVLEQRSFASRYRLHTGRDLLWMALALFLYGVIGQLFPKQTFLFPANWLNSDLFVQLFGFPIQLFRAIAAALMTVFFIRALRAFELESRNRRRLAQQETLTAQEQARQQTEQLNLQLQQANQDLSHLYQELQTRERLRRELLHQVVTAQEHERQRIARELHDTTGQALTALGLGFAAANETFQQQPERATRQLDELKKLSMQTLEDLRNLIGNLRPAVLDDLGLVPALQGHVREFANRTGLRTDLTLKGKWHRLPPEVETIVFRVVQEGLTNVARHAAAHTVSIQLDFQPDVLTLQIQDDGCGFEPEKAMGPQAERHAWGLLGMQERILLVNGQLHILSQPDHGTTIQVAIPLEQESLAHADHAY